MANSSTTPNDPNQQGQSGNLAVFDRLIGASDAIGEVRTLARRVAGAKISVLISGASGVGKDVVARLIHDLSPRRDQRFVPVNCGAIPEGLFESEMFGHEKGSFTGADRLRKGYFEDADGGTLLLDEVGEMPLAMQVKVLRALESGEYFRVGGARPRHADVRILAASNRDLAREVERGNFREDLYFRLRAVEIHIPPLRDRPEDIPPLVDRFVSEFCHENKLERPRLLREAVETLQNQEWRGNVRELKQFIGTLLTLESESPIDAAAVRRHLPAVTGGAPNLPILAPQQSRSELDSGLLLQLLLDMRRELQEVKDMVARALILNRYPTALPEQVPYREEYDGDARPTLQEMEIDLIKQALSENNGNRRKTAEALGIGERTLYRKIKEYNL